MRKTKEPRRPDKAEKRAREAGSEKRQNDEARAAPPDAGANQGSFNTPDQSLQYGGPPAEGPSPPLNSDASYQHRSEAVRPRQHSGAWLLLGVSLLVVLGLITFWNYRP